jgi:hypothetical protein
MTNVRALITGVSLLLGAPALRAQTVAALPVPCRDMPCALIVDWGVGKSLGDMPPDRKFGSAAEFEVAVREALRTHEMLGVANVADAKLSIRIQAAYKQGVLCDEVPGTNADRSCATIGEAIANFGTSAPEYKPPAALRIINRCGASTRLMTMKQFGAYVGESIWFALEGDKKKANKPSGKC